MIRARRKLALAALLCCACEGPRATPRDCQQLLDTIVAMELAAQGYEDPALVERKQAAARARYSATLRSCVGRRLPEGAMECAKRARDIEALIHRCLHE